MFCFSFSIHERTVCECVMCCYYCQLFVIFIIIIVIVIIIIIITIIIIIIIIIIITIFLTSKTDARQKTLQCPKVTLPYWRLERTENKCKNIKKQNKCRDQETIKYKMTIFSKGVKIQQRYILQNNVNLILSIMQLCSLGI